MTALSASSGHGAVAINYSDSNHSLLMQSSLGTPSVSIRPQASEFRYRRSRCTPRCDPDSPACGCLADSMSQPCLSTDHRSTPSLRPGRLGM